MDEVNDSRSTVDVALTAQMLSSMRLRGKGVVIIDILRASTTITHAVAEGARGLIPVRTVQRARSLGRRGEVLVGGERDGVPPDDFDMGNSPADYSRGRVEGRLVVLTTSNGTLAVHNAAGAGEVLVGCFNNVDAVVRSLRNSSRCWVLGCADTAGGTEVAPEDVFFAGEVVRRLQAGQEVDTSTGRRWRLTGAAMMARDFARFHRTDAGEYLAELPHALALADMGHRSDVIHAARRGITTVLPRVHTCTGQCPGCRDPVHSNIQLCIRAG